MDVDKSYTPDDATLTKLKAAGIDLSKLRKLIGNSKPQMTEHYFRETESG